MNAWTVDLPDLDPLSLNARQAHWAQRHRNVRVWREATGWAVKAARVPRLAQAIVTLHVTPPDRRRRDRHNLHATLKPILDALIDAGVIADDDPEHLAAEEIQVHPVDGVRRWRWRLEIRDAEEGV